MPACSLARKLKAAALSPVLARVETRGVSIDRSILSRLSGEFAQSMARLEAEIHELAGESFNLGSPKQLGDILFGKMGLPGAKKTATGAWSTSASVLEDLAVEGNDFSRRILDWRQLAKLKSTYADALPLADAVVAEIVAAAAAAAAAAQSDYQDLAPGGGIFGILPAVGGNDGAIWLQDAIFRMNFSPGPIFDFQPAETGIGTTIPGSLVKIGSLAGFISERGFQLWNGASQDIGHLKVDEYFWTNADELKLNLIRAAVHPKRKLILWAWASTEATSNTDRLLIFNFATGWWSYVEAEAELILSGFTAGYDLDTTAPYTDDDDADSDAPSLDSTAFMGGRVLMAGFDSMHQFGYFNGDSLAVTAETGEPDHPDGLRWFVDGLMPDTDAQTVTAAVGYRNSQSASVTYSTATSPASDLYCPQRVDAKYVRARVTIAAAQTWKHLRGVHVRMQTSGER